MRDLGVPHTVTIQDFIQDSVMVGPLVQKKADVTQHFGPDAVAHADIFKPDHRPAPVQSPSIMGYYSLLSGGREPPFPGRGTNPEACCRPGACCHHVPSGRTVAQGRSARPASVGRRSGGTAPSKRIGASRFGGCLPGCQALPITTQPCQDGGSHDS